MTEPLGEPAPPRKVWCAVCRFGPLVYSGRGRPKVTCDQSSCREEHRRRRQRANYAAQHGRPPAQEPLSAPGAGAGADTDTPAADQPVSAAAAARLAELAAARSAGFDPGGKRAQPRRRPGRRPYRPMG
jgi:hypothetical protein